MKQIIIFISVIKKILIVEQENLKDVKKHEVTIIVRVYMVIVIIEVKDQVY